MFNHIRDAREGFVDMSAGDKLLKVESIILGIVAFIYFIAKTEVGFFPSLIIAAVVAIVFPWLVGLIEIFAWIVTILFSIIWAVISYFIGGSLFNSAFAGVLIALLVFTISFFLHKIFAGLNFSSITSIMVDSNMRTERNTAATNEILHNNSQSQSQSAICSHCGATLKPEAKFCNMCGNRQN